MTGSPFGVRVEQLHHVADIVLDTSQGLPIPRKNFAYHRNATVSIGLDDQGVTEIDLDAERRLDVRKVRDQHRVGAGLRHRSDHLLHRLDPLRPRRRHWHARDWNKRFDQQCIGWLDSTERKPSGLEGTAQTTPQHLADWNAAI